MGTIKGSHMMKRNALLLLCGLLTITGCSTSVTDLTNDSKYSFMIGKQYQTQDDFVVTASQSQKKHLYLDHFGEQGVPERNEIKKETPYRYESSTIYGVLLKGSIFQISKVERHKNMELDQIDYEAKVISEGQFKGYIINVSFLTAGTVPEAPKFLDKYALEVK
jgi:DNA polymerase III alpha subunit